MLIWKLIPGPGIFADGVMLMLTGHHKTTDTQYLLTFSKLMEEVSHGVVKVEYSHTVINQS